ncbi:diguanylate cyclase (GGDEF) domain-containing protein [Micromonospora pattaloongensis]|uniref:Diguanylate cyclase (GGDEF) domain-containing protein n=1 Tax=Micromonospora pattaloongensis TaxID=405436 RepID=A0A1H3GLX2_9ACTN|nr:diguanylate cyclase [Micromonospora pattaloongensis]SDY04281.1 diguanylate cyclase (GGDEF) domain-containing protein [Micromonospora pattaloongensis]
MTLRGRLTAAFLAVVLGPVLLGAFFVASTVAAVSHNRSIERLDLAATSVRTSVSALCQQLHAAADAVAVLANPSQVAGAANQVVARGLASAVVVIRPDGRQLFATPSQPPRPWAECGGAGGDAGPAAIAARVEMRDAGGTPLGTVVVARHLDSAFVARLAAATGVAVTLLPGADTPADATLSTESPATRRAVVAAGERLSGDGTAETDVGRYVRRVGPSPGQPLPLVLSVPRTVPEGLYAVLVATVLLAGFCAVLAAWWLARSTTRPLAELAHAADRVADGDLAARVPVRTADEVGRLASTFNRMTRETQAYVQALTASRDQLRGHLAILGDTLSSTHDLQRILQVILQTALAATGARAGAVLLLDPATGLLDGQYAEDGPGNTRLAALPDAAGGADAVAPPVLPAGIGDHQPSTLTLPLGTGLLGSVVATGEPVRGRVDRDGPELSPDEPACRTYVAVPFSVAAPAVDPPRSAPGRPPAEPPTPAPPTSIGVLAVYDRLGFDEFDGADLATLRTFAAQAAVAVDNVRVHREAERLSMTDGLTGLWNYRRLQEQLHREIERSNRFGRTLTVLALDLDRFKEVNDTHGHPAGDTVLREFARRISAEIREVDVAFRNGGEEFVVLLPETDAHGGAVVAERLGAAIRDTPITIQANGGTDTVELPVTVSIGVAVYPEHGATGEQVLDAADDALYAAKAGGRDTYRVATVRPRPDGDEVPVASGPGSPEGDLPQAGGASFGPQPPRQSRGR